MTTYGTLDLLKRELRVTSNDDDDILNRRLISASRAVEEYCGRRFYTTEDTRLYTAKSRILPIDECTSITFVKVDNDGDMAYETTYAVDVDYRIRYDNGDNVKLFGISPITSLVAVNSWPLLWRGVQIKAFFGACTLASCPENVIEATLRLAQRRYKLRDSPFGLTGTPETGLMRVGTDRDIVELLEKYRIRLGFAACR